MKTRRALLSITAALVAATLGADAPGAEESTTVLSPQALQEIVQVEAEIDRIEAQAIERLAVPPDNQVQRVELLGKLMLYDKQLSVNRNEACAFCHTRETGFTGPVSELNRTTGSNRLMNSTNPPWPELEYQSWQDTRATLQLWTQIVGKNSNVVGSSRAVPLSFGVRGPSVVCDGRRYFPII
jgi:cytochrome c peroxidase